MSPTPYIRSQAQLNSTQPAHASSETRNQVRLKFLRFPDQESSFHLTTFPSSQVFQTHLRPRHKEKSGDDAKRGGVGDFPHQSSPRAHPQTNGQVHISTHPSTACPSMLIKQPKIMRVATTSGRSFQPKRGKIKIPTSVFLRMPRTKSTYVCVPAWVCVVCVRLCGLNDAFRKKNSGISPLETTEV